MTADEPQGNARKNLPIRRTTLKFLLGSLEELNVEIEKNQAEQHLSFPMTLSLI